MKEDYYHTKASVKEYIASAEGVDGSELIAKLKTYLPIHSTLLELGSGPGTDWKLLNQQYDVTGSDYSKEFLSHLRAQHQEGKFLELDAETLNTEQKFDGLYSNKVLHHLRDNQLQHSMKRQHAILSPSGIIFHSFWKGEGSEMFKGLFVNYHTSDELCAVVGQQFDILLLEPYEEFEADDSLLLIARKRNL